MKTVKILMLSLSAVLLTGCHVVMPAKPVGSDYTYARTHYQVPAGGSVSQPEVEAVTDAENAVAARVSPASTPMSDSEVPEPVVAVPAPQTMPAHYYPYMRRDVFSYALEAAVTVGQLCIQSGNCWRI